MFLFFLKLKNNSHIHTVIFKLKNLLNTFLKVNLTNEGNSAPIFFISINLCLLFIFTSKKQIISFINKEIISLDKWNLEQIIPKSNLHLTKF